MIRRALTILLALAFGCPRPASAYAVYTHAELIDLVWSDSIRPLLAARYPGTTDAQMEMAHSYAYGGCVIQDLGYYPFGEEFFSDLTHYVRSGDFVAALLENASNENELAFAIGALSHYIGDSIGHSQAVNPATAIAFPKLGKKYGPIVTYEQAKIYHGRTEFGFDVAQIAAHRFASHKYRDAIGFRVARELLDRAFFETYGLTVHSVLGPQRSAIGSYRFAVRKLLPEFVRIEVILDKGSLPQETDDSARQEYFAEVDRSEYKLRASGTYRSPGLGTHLLALVVRLIPRIGPLKILSIKAPDNQTEALYFKSINDATAIFRDRIGRLRQAPADPALPNRDLDTGDRVRPGAYRLTDNTYAKLLDKITTQQGVRIPQGLREDLLLYYSDPNAPIATKRDKQAWAKVLSELEQLKDHS